MALPLTDVSAILAVANSERSNEGSTGRASPALRADVWETLCHLAAVSALPAKLERAATEVLALTIDCAAGLLLNAGNDVDAEEHSTELMPGFLAAAARFVQTLNGSPDAAAAAAAADGGHGSGFDIPFKLPRALLPEQDVLDDVVSYELPDSTRKAGALRSETAIRIAVAAMRLLGIAAPSALGPPSLALASASIVTVERTLARLGSAKKAFAMMLSSTATRPSVFEAAVVLRSSLVAWLPAADAGVASQLRMLVGSIDGVLDGVLFLPSDVVLGYGGSLSGALGLVQRATLSYEAFIARAAKGGSTESGSSSSKGAAAATADLDAPPRSYRLLLPVVLNTERRLFDMLREMLSRGAAELSSNSGSPRACFSSACAFLPLLFEGYVRGSRSNRATSLDDVDLSTRAIARPSASAPALPPAKRARADAAGKGKTAAADAGPPQTALDAAAALGKAAEFGFFAECVTVVLGLRPLLTAAAATASSVVAAMTVAASAAAAESAGKATGGALSAPVSTADAPTTAVSGSDPLTCLRGAFTFDGGDLQLVVLQLRALGALLDLTLVHNTYAIHEDAAPFPQTATLFLIARWALRAMQSALGSRGASSSAGEVEEELLSCGFSVLGAVLELNHELVKPLLQEALETALSLAPHENAIREEEADARPSLAPPPLSERRISTCVQFCGRVVSTFSRLRQLDVVLGVYTSLLGLSDAPPPYSSNTASAAAPVSGAMLLNVLLHRAHVAQLETGFKELPSGQVGAVADALKAACDWAVTELRRSLEETTEPVLTAAGASSSKARKAATKKSATTPSAPSSTRAYALTAARVSICTVFLASFTRQLTVSSSTAVALAKHVVRIADGIAGPLLECAAIALARVAPATSSGPLSPLSPALLLTSSASNLLAVTTDVALCIGNYPAISRSSGSLIERACADAWAAAGEKSGGDSCIPTDALWPMPFLHPAAAEQAAAGATAAVASSSSVVELSTPARFSLSRRDFSALLGASNDSTHSTSGATSHVPFTVVDVLAAAVRLWRTVPAAGLLDTPASGRVMHPSQCSDAVEALSLPPELGLQSIARFIESRLRLTHVCVSRMNGRTAVAASATARGSASGAPAALVCFALALSRLLVSMDDVRLATRAVSISSLYLPSSETSDLLSRVIRVAIGASSAAPAAVAAAPTQALIFSTAAAAAAAAASDAATPTTTKWAATFLRDSDLYEVPSVARAFVPAVLQSFGRTLHDVGAALCAVVQPAAALSQSAPSAKKRKRRDGDDAGASSLAAASAVAAGGLLTAFADSMRTGQYSASSARALGAVLDALDTDAVSLLPSASSPHVALAVRLCQLCDDLPEGALASNFFAAADDTAAAPPSFGPACLHDRTLDVVGCVLLAARVTSTAPSPFPGLRFLTRVSRYAVLQQGTCADRVAAEVCRLATNDRGWYHAAVGFAAISLQNALRSKHGGPRECFTLLGLAAASSSSGSGEWAMGDAMRLGAVVEVAKRHGLLSAAADAGPTSSAAGVTSLPDENRALSALVEECLLEGGARDAAGAAAAAASPARDLHAWALVNAATSFLLVAAPEFAASHKLLRSPARASSKLLAAWEATLMPRSSSSLSRAAAAAAVISSSSATSGECASAASILLTAISSALAVAATTAAAAAAGAAPPPALDRSVYVLLCRRFVSTSTMKLAVALADTELDVVRSLTPHVPVALLSETEDVITTALLPPSSFSAAPLGLSSLPRTLAWLTEVLLAAGEAFHSARRVASLELGAAAAEGTEAKGEGEGDAGFGAEAADGVISESGPTLSFALTSTVHAVLPSLIDMCAPLRRASRSSAPTPLLPVLNLLRVVVSYPGVLHLRIDDLNCAVLAFQRFVAGGSAAGEGMPRDDAEVSASASSSSSQQQQQQHFAAPLRLGEAGCRLLLALLKFHRDFVLASMPSFAVAVSSVMEAIVVQTVEAAEAAGTTDWSVVAGGVTPALSMLSRVMEQFARVIVVAKYHGVGLLMQYLLLATAGRGRVVAHSNRAISGSDDGGALLLLLRPSDATTHSVTLGLNERARRVLQPGVFALLNVLSSKELQQLHSGLSQRPAARAMLRSVYDEYVATAKFGKTQESSSSKLKM